MAVRSVRNAAAVVPSNNDLRNSSVLRSSNPRLRRPRGSGRESVAGVVAAEIAGKNPLRIRVLSRRNSRAHRASRVLPDHRRPRVRMPRERQRRVRKAMDRNAVVVFGVAGVVVADRRVLRRLRSHAESRSRGERLLCLFGHDQHQHGAADLELRLVLNLNRSRDFDRVDDRAVGRL